MRSKLLYRCLLLSAMLWFWISNTAKANEFSLLAQGMNDDVPITLAATGALSWDAQAKQYHGTGGVRLKRDTLVLTASNLTASYDDSSGKHVVTYIVASGNVRIAVPQAQLNSDKVTIVLATQTITASGDAIVLETPDYRLESAETLIYQHTAQQATAYEPATLIQKATGHRIRAQKLTATFVQPQQTPQLRIASATGDVMISTMQEQAGSDYAEYTAANDTIQLRGNVRLSQGESEITSDSLSMNLLTGVSNLNSQPQPAARSQQSLNDSTATFPPSPIGRVRGILHLEALRAMEPR